MSPSGRRLASQMALAWRQSMARDVSVIIGLLVVLAGALPRAAWAGDPRLRWRTIETAHFRIHFHERERPLARRVAAVAEHAHRTLVPHLKHRPRGPTHIVISDDTDFANGSAMVLPYNLVRVFATAPEAQSVLNDHDDWMLGLVLHEYSHILHLDNISGPASLVNRVFGKIWAPNQIQPTFIIEGYATYGETKHTSAGRGRSALFDMYLRSALLEGKLLKLDEITQGTPLKWPQAMTPYLYGVGLVSYVADRYGDEALGRLSTSYGGAEWSFWVPFGLNRALRRTIGKGWDEIYEEWVAHLRRRYDLQVAEARARGLTAFQRVTYSGYGHDSPVFSADGHELLWVENDGTDRQKWMAARIESTGGSRPVVGPHRRVRYIRGLGQLTLGPGGMRAVHQEYAPFETYYGYTDLFEYNFDTRQSRRLTKGARAREPAYSPDGRRLAFAQGDLGTSWVAVMPARGGEARVVYRGPRFSQVSTPAWSPDGTELAFSVWEPGGYRDMVALNLTSGKARHLTRDRAIDLDPAYTPDGRFLLFVSDRTGVYNIFALERSSGTLWQVTNVLGGAFQPAVSPDGRLLAYQGFGANGYDIHLMTLEPKRFLAALPYVDERPPAPRVAELQSPPKERSYSPLATVWPRTYELAYGPDSFGNAVTVRTDGRDAIGRHAWYAGLTIGLERGTVNTSGSYWYNRLWPSLGLGAFRGISRRSGLYVDGQNYNYIETTVGGSAALSFPIYQTADRSVSLSTSYRLEHLTNQDAGDIPYDPNDVMPQLPEDGRLGSLAGALSYADAQSFLYSVSPERGRYVHVGVSAMHRVLGSDYNVVQGEWVWLEYLRNPLFRRHVLAVRYAGGLGEGDLRRRGVFWLGGYGSQDDVLRTYIDPRAPRGGGVALRGYPPFSLWGDQFHLLNLEYRFPILYVHRGVLTLPWWLSRVYGAVYADYGNAFFGSIDLADFKLGLGGHVSIDTKIGYHVPATVTVGYARGVMAGATNQYYVFVGGSF